MSEEHFHPKPAMDFDARSPVSPDKFQFVELSMEETAVTTEACPSEKVHLASEPSLTDGERSEDETEEISDFSDSEKSQKQADANHDSSSDTECSHLCPLRDYFPIDESPSRPHYDPEHELPDQAIQAARLYRPISDWQSRIIALHPGEPGDPIIVDLHIADLINASGIALHDMPLRVQYEALSYCWGAENATCVIQMNGIDYPVVETLYQALQRLRTDEVRYLWIDALCIDQHNLEERSMQVANMLLLFQKATKVLVWLGEHVGYTRAAWQCLDKGKCPDIGIRLSNACPKHQSIISLGFEGILSRPWYRRLWILQEIWAATQVDVILGEDIIKWHMLETFATQFERIIWHKVSTGETSSWPLYRNDNPFIAVRRAAVREEVYGDSYDRSRKWLLQIQDSYEGWPGNRGKELIDVLGGTYTCECKDPRDRVYAVLGMTNAPYAAVPKVALSDKRTITVDYGKSIGEVYQDVVRYYARIDKNLDILCMDASFGGKVGGEELPSWCPNWSLPIGKDRPYRMKHSTSSKASQGDWSDMETPKRKSGRSRFEDEGQHYGCGELFDLETPVEDPPRQRFDYVDEYNDHRAENLGSLSWKVLPITGTIFAVVTGAVLWQDFTTYQNSIITIERDALTTLPRGLIRERAWSRPGYRSSGGELAKDPRSFANKGPEAAHWYMSGKPPRIHDVIVAAERVSLPLVLRQRATNSQYQFVGVVENPGSKFLSEIRKALISDFPSCLHIV